MAHHAQNTETLTHEQLKFKEHTERAASFVKIDLFRSAREEFKAALQYQPGNGECLQQIDIMNTNIERDRKSVLIIVGVVVIILVVTIAARWLLS